MKNKKEERTETAPQILSFLALDKPSSKWELSKELGKSYGNVHETVQQLLGDELIKIEYTRPGEKNRKIEVEYYSLTLKGLLTAIYEIPLTPELDSKQFKSTIKEIVTKQNTKHPLFAKWSRLSQIIPEDEMIASLYGSAAEITFALKREQQEKAGLEKHDLEDWFMEMFLYPALYPELGRQHLVTAKNWIKAVQEDSDLKEYVQKKLTETKNLHQQHIEQQEKLLKQITGEKLEGSHKNIDASSHRKRASNPTTMISYLYSFGSSITILRKKKLDELKTTTNTIRDLLILLIDNARLLAIKGLWLKRYKLVHEYLSLRSGKEFISSSRSREKNMLKG